MLLLNLIQVTESISGSVVPLAMFFSSVLTIAFKYSVVLKSYSVYHRLTRVAEVARPPVSASAGAPALAGSPSIRAFVAKSVLMRITRYWIHYFQLFSATSTVKMPVFMKNYKFCWQNCKKNDVYVAKICNGKIRCFCRENLQTRALR